MVVVTVIEVGAEDFKFGEFFTSFQDIEIELERVVPIDPEVTPLFWVKGGEPDQIMRTIRSDPAATTIQLLTQQDDRSLFQIDWDSSSDTVIRLFNEHNSKVLLAKGNPETWRFKLQFSNNEQLAAFQNDCISSGVHLEPLRVMHSAESTNENLLTTGQLEALLRSYEAGYWDVPRETSLSRLSDEMGISDTAVSERIRRGIKTLVEETITDSTITSDHAR